MREGSGRSVGVSSRLPRAAIVAVLAPLLVLLSSCGLWLPPRCDDQQNIDLVEDELFEQGRKKYGSLTKYASYTIEEIGETALDWREGVRSCVAYVDLKIEFPTSLGPLTAKLRIEFDARLSGFGGALLVDTTKVERL